jgi:hypothetical protein
MDGSRQKHWRATACLLSLEGEVGWGSKILKKAAK